MTPHTRVFVAGGNTLYGHALTTLLRAEGFESLVGVGTAEPDLTDAAATDAFFAQERPECVFLCAGRSGGIGLNRAAPVELMRDNLLTTLNVLASAHRHGTAKLLYLASSCAYPKHAAQPLQVESLGTGPMEPTSEAYSTAKFAGWKLCDAYRREYGCRFVTGFPANAFGPHDDFTPEGGHVIPALLRRAHDAKSRGDAELVVWGTGAPRREFVYSRDLARACLFVARNYEGEAPINLGGGTDLSIADVAHAVAEVVGFKGRLVFDTTKPDGAPLKALDSAPLLDMGWRPESDFRAALNETYHWFLHHRATEGRTHARRAV
ncbi:GDP-L-fucose synthase [Gemmata obscuriglobus]|uniref:GDP-L-fucose synthase n=1 Tax=Gemmata obscuriglobus TaxID=114 RepID=A0A2Z3GVH9_9BACT|nr:GDP-L-fucose synthase [Gemmata obscuriglobus]AWM36551.1 GDP-fucose synthetase [Gemmata obscuriglobus]QEG30823.1 GDP-L-fucose synthase [Gemmata obscuriglobus]VTS10154.1 gdp-l-fucose synthase : GDP-L-fucose synthase OS=Thermus aquaticus Y51MC23 GN=fcl PE=3 SV=1: Epimerase [Gemmata obscuriglobus UQM 2246]